MSCWLRHITGEKKAFVFTRYIQDQNFISSTSVSAWLVLRAQPRFEATGHH